MGDIVVGNMELRYLESGSGPTVYLIHGFGSGPHYWSEVVKHLESEFRVIVPNLKSFFSTYRGISFTEQVELLEEFVRRTAGHSDVHMVGASYGATLTWGVRKRMQDELCSHTLINPMPLEPLKHFRNPMLRMILSLGYLPGGLRLFLRSPLGQRTLEGMAKIFRLGIVGKKNIKFFNTRKLMLVEKAIRRFAWIIRQEDWEKWGGICHKETPTSLLYSTNDRLFRPDIYENYAPLIKNCQLQSVPRAGHLLVKMEPETAIKAIRESLTQAA